MVSAAIAKKLPSVILHTAENGAVGLEFFKEHNPDIVLTDICMPVMDGIQMARSIRALNSSANIIVTTAISDTHYLLDSFKIGVSRYVLKPIDIHKLFEAMDDCIARIVLERQVKEQNDFIRKLSSAVEQSPSMVMITDAEGAIEYVNPKFTELTGYTAEEVMGQNPRILRTDATPAETVENLWRTITNGREWRGEFLNRKKNGDPYWEAASISPLFGEEGVITHFIALKEDITDRKQAEEEILRLNETLEQRVKERTVALEATNQELEAFCYSIAHDLSTPLRGLSGFSSILLEEYADKLDEAGKEYLTRIGAAAVRMGRLISDLLNLSRVTRSALRREKVNLGALARDIVTVLNGQEPERRVAVAIPEMADADGDPELVRLMLENLLDNAWKYTSKEPNSMIEFGSSSIKGETVYFVRDNGIGFDMAYASKIFIPFQRLHGIGEFEGTGIGLATAQRVIAMHGGRIWAEGEVAKGATFYFTLG
jgi:PAS domain S-box-containing protein